MYTGLEKSFAQKGSYGYGNDYGIYYAYTKLKSDYIVIANPNVEFTEDCIHCIKKRFRFKFRSCGGICSGPDIKWKETVWNHLEITKCKRIYVFSKYIYSKLFKSLQYPHNYFNDKTICQVDCVPGSLLMVNAKLMFEYGMYDEDIFLYCEETILGYKLKQKGLKTVLPLNQSFIHRHSESINKTISSARDRRNLLLKSRIIVLKKYYKIFGLKLFFVKLFYKFTLLENTIIYFFKGAL